MNAKSKTNRISRTEALEARRLMAADPISVGVVYLETDYLETDQDGGNDSQGDRFILSFTGGAADTELSELRIVTDKDGDGISVGDPIYDTAAGGRGKEGFAGFQIVRVLTADGRTVDARAEVEDGGQELVLRLSNFRAGDRLEFTLDVDEVLRNAVDLEIFNDRLDVITSGQEFQDSILEATFEAPHFETAEADAVFLNEYDPQLSGTGLNLPPDESDDPDSRPNRSAAAIGQVTQTARPIDIAGRVWVDNDLDSKIDAGERMLSDVELTLFQQQPDGRYTDTGLRAMTDAQGRYVFPKSLGLMPGTYRIVETQPAGLFSVAAIPGTVSGASVGSVESLDALTGIAIADGGTSAIDYDFAEAEPASIGGFVYQDNDNDGIKDAGEVGIAGVRVRLLPIDTLAPQSVLTVTSAADGSYTFTGLAPGSYEIIEVDQPLHLNDGLDTAGTIDGNVVGLAENPGDAIRAITLAGGDVGVDYNFGETPFGSLAGFVYLAAPGSDCDGSHDSEDLPLADVRVVLETAGGQFVAETRTGTDGGYQFDDVPVGDYRIVEFTPAGLIDGDSHVGSLDGIRVGTSDGGGLLRDIVMTPSGQGTEYNFCEAAPASISGHVYHDADDDGMRETGETAISGATVRLVDDEGTVVASATTDADGRYRFDGVTPGTYSIVEDQPNGFLDGRDSVGTVRGRRVGQDSGGDALDRITLHQGDVGVDYDFGELMPASLFGRVHVDLDDDCLYDEGEPLLADVVIRLFDAGGNEVAVTTTDRLGRYGFEDLVPGEYTVIEDQPEGYFEGGTRVGSAGGTVEAPSRIGRILLDSGETAVEYDFCEKPPAEINGLVFVDRDGDCVFDSDEPAIDGVLIELFDTDGTKIAETVTDAAGRYRFTGLTAGVYSVRETQPPGYLQGGQRAGSAGGDDSVADRITRIPVSWGERLIEYNFCEVEPSSVAGTVYVDGNGDCVQQGTEPPLEGVTVELRDGSGRFVARTTTDAAGNYHFENLRPGNYQIFEVQPDGYFQGGQTVGTGDGEVLGEDLLGVTLSANEDLVDYDFCEIPPGSIRGGVYVDDDGDCVWDDDEPPIAGVVIELRDGDGDVVASTRTGADGSYAFEGLAPGRYQIFELQPDGFFQGGQTVGTGDGEVLGRDLLGVRLEGGEDVVDYDFCELPPGSIRGSVYVDADGDCVWDDDEPALSGVMIELRDESGVTVTTTRTADDGSYVFDGLAPGRYQIFEQQPDGFFQGGQMVGTGDGEVLGEDLLGVRLAGGQHVVDYDFCELPPASIAGGVWREATPDGVFDDDDVPLPGVLIELLGESGDVIGSTRTDEAGEYSFENLAPGVYSVRETQPPGYFHGGQVVGTIDGQVVGDVGGDDLLVGITLSGGDAGLRYDFPEIPPAVITGVVFQDGEAIRTRSPIDPSRLREFRDGIYTLDDTPLGGVTLELRNVLGQPFDASRALPGQYAGGPIRVTTDAEGNYEFAGLRPGTYHVYQVQPEGYSDGLDTPGSSGGVAINPADALTTADRIFLQTLAASSETDPGVDAILNISLSAGGRSEDNHFSEIVTRDFLIDTPIEPDVAPERVTQPIENFESPIRLMSFATVESVRPPTRFFEEWAVSWHLSVINGGIGDGVNGESVFQPASSVTVRTNFEPGEHGLGRWTIADRDGNLLSIADRYALGDQWATALAGDFDGDGVDEAVIYVGGDWFVDFNGDGRWDRGDLWIRLGTQLDRPVVGDWDGDGKDDIGIFGRQWELDPLRIVRDPGLPDPANLRRREIADKTLAGSASTDQDAAHRYMRRGETGKLRADAVDHVFEYGEQADMPIAGDWNGDGIDQIAVFRGGHWMLDADGDGRWTDRDVRVKFGKAGDEPIRGDFNGDGIDEIGIVRGDVWIIDTDGDRRMTGNDLQIEVPRGGPNSQPVVGDFDGDGIDEAAFYDESA